MNYDRLEFLDAVEELARARRPGSAARHARSATPIPRRATCTRALDAARDFFRKQLARSDKARAYVEKRGIDAGDRRALRASAMRRTASTALRDALGTDAAPDAAARARRAVLEERQGPRLRQVPRPADVPDPRPPRPHDRLRRPRASTRRTRRSTSTRRRPPLFHKGRELYGLWQARAGQPEARAADRGRGLHGRGRAVRSTACRRRWPRWAPRPRRTTPSCCSATRPTCTSASTATAPAARAAWKALESVLPRMKDGRQAFFLFLPDGEDPDSHRAPGRRATASTRACATPRRCRSSSSRSCRRT